MRRHHWERLGRAEAELLQHEIDHLSGVLAVDRAERGDADVVRREEYLARQAEYDASVECALGASARTVHALSSGPTCGTSLVSQPQITRTSSPCRATDRIEPTIG